MSYVEPGGSWRPFWIVAGTLGLFAVLDLALPGPDVPRWLWALAVVTVLGAVGIGCLRARRVWTVRVDAGAPVLGGGWTLPAGRSGLPLRLHGGRTVLVPARDPAALHAALLAAVSDASDGRSGREGTLGS